MFFSHNSKSDHSKLRTPISKLYRNSQFCIPNQYLLYIYSTIFKSQELFSLLLTLYNFSDKCFIESVILLLVTRKPSNLFSKFRIKIFHLKSHNIPPDLKISYIQVLQGKFKCTKRLVLSYRQNKLLILA